MNILNHDKSTLPLMRNTLGHNLTKKKKIMIQRLNNDPYYNRKLNNDSGQDSGNNFPNETQIMHINSPDLERISRFGESLRYCEYSPADLWYNICKNSKCQGP